MLKRGLPSSHPGEILKKMHITPLEITVTETAVKLGITRKTLSELMNGQRRR